MPATAELHASITLESAKVVPTGADTMSPATIEDPQKVQSRQRWQELIDGKLIAWLQDPAQLADDGLEPPTGRTLRLAIDYAEKYRDKSILPPSSIVPDPNGGIVFELRQNGASEVIHFWDDGTVEYQRFCGTSLVERSLV